MTFSIVHQWYIGHVLMSFACVFLPPPSLTGPVPMAEVAAASLKVVSWPPMRCGNRCFASSATASSSPGQVIPLIATVTVTATHTATWSTAQQDAYTTALTSMCDQLSTTVYLSTFSPLLVPALPLAAAPGPIRGQGRGRGVPPAPVGPSAARFLAAFAVVIGPRAALSGTSSPRHHPWLAVGVAPLVVRIDYCK